MTDVKVLDHGARQQYTAATGQTLFTYLFLIFEKEDLAVFLTPVGQVPNPQTDRLTVDTDYTVTGVGNQDGGDVVLIVPAVAGDIITIERAIALTQLVDLTTGGDFKAKTINFVHDKATLLIQQNKSLIEKRMLLYQVTDNLSKTGGDTVLPQLPPNTGAGIPIWTKNNAGNLVAGVCDETTTCSTLRSELASQTEVAPGTDDVGYFDLKAQTGKLLTVFLNELNNLVEAGDKYNYIINGDMNFWQRELTHNFVGSVTAYTADRWFFVHPGGTTTVSRKVAPISDSGGARFFLNINRTVGSVGGTLDLTQKIENVKLLDDTTVSIAVTTNLISPAALELKVEFQRFFGTGGSPSPTVQIGTTTLNLVNGITVHNIIITIPALTSEVLGTDNNDSLKLIFFVDPTLTFNLDIGNVSQIESDRQHKFHPRLYQEELALCERYYQKSYNVDTPPGTITSVGVFEIQMTEMLVNNAFAIQSTANFSTPMRTTPSVVVFSPLSSTPNNILLNATTQAPSGLFPSEKNVSVQGQSVAPASDRRLVYQWTAEAEL